MEDQEYRDLGSVQVIPGILPSGNRVIMGDSCTGAGSVLSILGAFRPGRKLWMQRNRTGGVYHG